MTRHILVLFFLMIAVFDAIAGYDSNSLIEKLRWGLPADAWRYHEGYTAKGNFIRISSRVGKDVFTGLVEGMRVYENPSLKGKAYILNNVLIKDEEQRLLCSYDKKDGANFVLDKLLICDNFCRNLTLFERKTLSRNNQSKKNIGISTYSSLLLTDTYSSCKINFDGFIKNYILEDGPDKDNISEYLTRMSPNVISGESLYLRTKDTDLKKKYVVLEVEGRDYYLDISFCEKISVCRIVNIENSEYERDQERLKKLKENKSFWRMNFLIKNLKPCVLKKNKECIKKFFPKAVSDNEDLDGENQFKKLVFDDDFFKELEACLDYKNLLPHLRAFRGVNKACVFNESETTEYYLLKIDYPESVRFGSDIPVYVIEK